ncbi:hypothetical protein LTR85_010117 [Meristemomyces frigidus]|nr:hypothetical protein LTR85_010117 [Meristemomyces frigidus]
MDQALVDKIAASGDQQAAGAVDAGARLTNMEERTLTKRNAASGGHWPSDDRSRSTQKTLKRSADDLQQATIKVARKVSPEKGTYLSDIISIDPQQPCRLNVNLFDPAAVFAERDSLRRHELKVLRQNPSHQLGAWWSPYYISVLAAIRFLDFVCAQHAQSWYGFHTNGGTIIKLEPTEEDAVYKASGSNATEQIAGYGDEAEYDEVGVDGASVAEQPGSNLVAGWSPSKSPNSSGAAGNGAVGLRVDERAQSDAAETGAAQHETAPKGMNGHLNGMLDVADTNAVDDGLRDDECGSDTCSVGAGAAVQTPADDDNDEEYEPPEVIGCSDEDEEYEPSEFIAGSDEDEEYEPPVYVCLPSTG